MGVQGGRKGPTVQSVHKYNLGNIPEYHRVNEIWHCTLHLMEYENSNIGAIKNRQKKPTLQTDLRMVDSSWDGWITAMKTGLGL
jgi:hypothetical protein